MAHYSCAGHSTPLPLQGTPSDPIVRYDLASNLSYHIKIFRRDPPLDLHTAVSDRDWCMSAATFKSSLMYWSVSMGGSHTLYTFPYVVNLLKTLLALST
jgi:hypothetical protein